VIVQAILSSLRLAWRSLAALLLVGKQS